MKKKIYTNFNLSLCTFPIKNFLGNAQVLWWAMSAIYSLSWESWLAYVAFIEGNFLQCGPQYIAVFGGTIPLLVRIMWALPIQFQGHFPQYTHDIIMEFLLKIHYYLPTLYTFIFAYPNPYSPITCLP